MITPRRLNMVDIDEDIEYTHEEDWTNQSNYIPNDTIRAGDSMTQTMTPRSPEDTYRSSYQSCT